jgi:hypothetical protein
MTSRACSATSPPFLREQRRGLPRFIAIVQGQEARESAYRPDRICRDVLHRHGCARLRHDACRCAKMSMREMRTIERMVR